MHIDFVLYGERSSVERMLREMEGQKHFLPMTKGKKNKKIYVPGQIRELPFGIKEYICPKEDRDAVLRTLNALTENETGVYGVRFKKFVYPFLRKVLKLKPVPKYDRTKGAVYLWNKAHTSSVVLGIREDEEIVGVDVDDKGWTHERL